MMPHFLAVFLFSQSMLFGYLGAAINLLFSNALQKNANNLSDGLIIGLITFNLLPHLHEHWTHDGGTVFSLIMILAAPIIVAVYLGNKIEKINHYVLGGTASIFLFHSLVEGVALGVNTALGHSLVVISILIHKTIECFCFSNQISQLTDKPYVTTWFVLINSLVIFLSFEAGIYLHSNFSWIHQAELLFDLLTVMSLIFLVIFCNFRAHDKTCSHRLNSYSCIGLGIVLMLSQV